MPVRKPRRRAAERIMQEAEPSAGTLRLSEPPQDWVSRNTRPVKESRSERSYGTNVENQACG